jgi:hypothetical protein
MRVELLRTTCSDCVTLGVVRINGVTIFASLELPYRNNAPRISCIDNGKYDCQLVKSPKFGEVYEITHVPGRSEILIHPGNTVRDIQGCVLLGLGHYYDKGQSSVFSSKIAIERFRSLIGTPSFALEVRSIP